MVATFDVFLSYRSYDQKQVESLARCLRDTDLRFFSTAGTWFLALSLAICERLAKAEPRYFSWQRNLSVSYDNLGAVLSKQNQRDRALTLFEKSRAIGERAVKPDSSSASGKAISTGWTNELPN